MSYVLSARRMKVIFYLYACTFSARNASLIGIWKMAHARCADWRQDWTTT